VSDVHSKQDGADIIEHASLLAELERIELPADYRPGEDEPFMNERQLAYFRAKLLKWKADIAIEAKATLDTLKEGPIQEPDQTDRASSETDWALELRTRDRQRKLISKIDAAIRRIETGDYGYCEITGEPISLQRLEARPIATMTLEAQERHEREERVSRDDDLSATRRHDPYVCQCWGWW
jgi:DnaK suppressor protein